MTTITPEEQEQIRVTMKSDPDKIPYGMQLAAKCLADLKAAETRAANLERDLYAVRIYQAEAEAEVQRLQKYEAFYKKQCLADLKAVEAERDWLAQLCGQMVAPKDEEAQKRFAEKFLEEARQAAEAAKGEV